MKKLRKLTLSELKTKNPVMGFKEQNSIKGGWREEGDHYVYTESEVNMLQDNGVWNGGYVDYAGSGSGSSTEFYTGLNTTVTGSYSPYCTITNYANLNSFIESTKVAVAGAQQYISDINTAMHQFDGGTFVGQLSTALDMYNNTQTAGDADRIANMQKQMMEDVISMGMTSSTVSIQQSGAAYILLDSNGHALKTYYPNNH